MLQLWFIANTMLWQFNAKPGGISLSMNVVVLMAAGAVWFLKNRKIAYSTVTILFVLGAYLVFSSMAAIVGPCSDHLQKAFLTLPVIVFLALTGLEVGRRATSNDWIKLQTTALWVLAVAFSAFIAELLIPSLFPNQAGYRADGKLSGMFHEPSHNAFSLFPCIAILLASGSKKMRRYGMVALVGLLVLSRSSTLIALFASWAVYRLIAQKNIRTAVFIIVGLAVVITLGATIDFDHIIKPTMERVTGVATSSETENISSLVYVQGWQDTLFNLEHTHGLGLGLNMMGCGSLPNVPARSALELMVPVELNAEDGSFLFAKVVSEAGLLGIAFYILAIGKWVKFENSLRRHGRDAMHFAMMMQGAIMFCFVASSFIRGAGYFSGSLLLWISAIGGASVRRRGVAEKPVLSAV